MLVFLVCYTLKMNILIALLLLFPIPPPVPPCHVYQAPVGELVIHIPDRQVTGVIYTNETVGATNGHITGTIDFSHGWIVGWPPYDTRLTSDRPYIVYVCRSGHAPGVMYLPMI
jgi:hypothetical protein